MRNTAAWMQALAYALLALAIAGAALAFASLRVINDTHIAGAGPGYRYYTLGVQRSTGPDFSVDSAELARLAPLLPPEVKAAVASYGHYVLRGGAGDAVSASDVSGALVSSSYLDALHLRPLAGRLLQAGDIDDCTPAVVISESLARKFFGAPDRAVGGSLRVGYPGDASPDRMQVVGVLSDRFRGALPGHAARIWMPISQMPPLNHLPFTACSAKEPHAGGTGFALSGLPGILSAPATMPEAQLHAILQAAWKRLPADARSRDESGFACVAPYSANPHARVLAARRITLYLGLAVAALALATVNVFTLRWLALVRTRHVLQLERVLGATRAWLRRRYLLRMVWTALALLAGSGVLVAAGYRVLHALLADAGDAWARLQPAAVTRELAWSLPLLLLIVVLAEALPLLLLMQRERLDAGARVTLSRSDRSVGAAVMVAEVLLAAVMSCAAGWSLHFAWQQRHADLGMLHAPATILTIGRRPGGPTVFANDVTSKSKQAPAQVLLMDAIRHAVHSVQPGAAVATGPLPDSNVGMPDVSLGHGATVTRARSDSAGPDWLQAASVHLLAGSGFSADRPDPDAVLIDAGTARALFGDVRSAIGSQIDIPGKPPSHVIGVIAPLYLQGPDHDATRVVIFDMRRGNTYMAMIGGQAIVRPQVPDARVGLLQAAVAAALQRQAPGLRLESIRSSQQLMMKLTRAPTRQAQVFVLIALFAWAIALSGVAAHLRLYLALRRRLAAIRGALGAGPRRLYGEVLGGVLLLAGIGVVLALFAAPWLAQQFALLSGARVAPFGAVTWLALAVLLLAVLAITHAPARRAARAEPAQSLHEL